jgi:hypothetical protein
VTAASALVAASMALGVAATAVGLCLAERRARRELEEAPGPVWRRVPPGGHPAIEGWVPAAEAAGTVPRADDRFAARHPSLRLPGGPHGRPAQRRCRRNVDHRW